ncbi:hypothetical protein EGT50_01870 [Rhodococcus xishaensis]|uniref:Uncharacterized protein n=1 Tax=Rhodococcus xishaensis TaxID=2487364 RepID=A0A438B327_9NOCA|nr:hypothetical protein EGT50_01870 [Rhodococcus xishaensis]
MADGSAPSSSDSIPLSDNSTLRTETTSRTLHVLTPVAVFRLAWRDRRAGQWRGIIPVDLHETDLALIGFLGGAMMLDSTASSGTCSLVVAGRNPGTPSDGIVRKMRGRNQSVDAA